MRRGSRCARSRKRWSGGFACLKLIGLKRLALPTSFAGRLMARLGMAILCLKFWRGQGGAGGGASDCGARTRFGNWCCILRLGMGPCCGGWAVRRWSSRMRRIFLRLRIRARRPGARRWRRCGAVTRNWLRPLRLCRTRGLRSGSGQRGRALQLLLHASWRGAA